MSTDPRSSENPEQTGAAPARWELTPGRSPGTSRSGPRAGSGMVARGLTVLFALIATPLATGLVMYGGMPWQQHLMMMGTDVGGLLQFLFSPSGLPALLAMVGGLLLLVSVVVTGLASSAGLLSVSVLSVFPLSLSITPQLNTTLYEVLPEPLRLTSFGLFSQGAPLVLYPALGGLGLALAIARRRPRPHLAISLSGVVVLPLVMLAGSLLVMYGYGAVMRSYAISFGAEPIPIAAGIALVAGMVLLWLSVGAVGASPWALVLPALLVLAFSAAFLMPGFFMMLPSAMFSPTGSAALSVVALGTGPAIGLMWLIHTAVQLTVASRARRRQPSPSAL